MSLIEINGHVFDLSMFKIALQIIETYSPCPYISSVADLLKQLLSSNFNQVHSASEGCIETLHAQVVCL